jgi:hypothetical protein
MVAGPPTLIPTYLQAAMDVKVEYNIVWLIMLYVIMVEHIIEFVVILDPYSVE